MNTSLDQLRADIERSKAGLADAIAAQAAANADVRDARKALSDAMRYFNHAVADLRPKRKSPEKKIDTGAAFHPESKQVDLEQAIAAKSHENDPGFAPRMVA